MMHHFGCQDYGSFNLGYCKGLDEEFADLTFRFNFSVEKAWQLSNDIPRAESLEELLEQSDFITIHIPYTDKNRNIIGE